MKGRHLIPTDPGSLNLSEVFYFQAALPTIRAERDMVLARGADFGGKIVRGAYLEKERRLAAQNGKLKSPEAMKLA